ncbi:MAG: hypothetical protein KDD69_05905 [Bdellovibrionales bacterium]|nr:hypothetical protein [Bdellovibrionales bacterium]
MADGNKNSGENPEENQFADELDEYDLLGSGSNAIPDVDLSATARAFNTRIKERKKAQELASGEAEKAAQQRRALMVKGLVSIRKSLREVVRIDLGERFRFMLEADDWMGWPRLTVRLLDSEIPEEEYPQFTVTAHDRQAKGLIEIALPSQSEPAKISLLRESDLMRLPKVLRTCVRSYLDFVGDVILDADAADEPDDTFLEAKDAKEFEEQKKSEAIAADLFVDEFAGDDLFESLPQISEIRAIESPFDFDAEE